MSEDRSPSFGTSGLRGLVSTLTPDVVTAYVKAFLLSCPHGGRLFVGYDLRPSSPDIAGFVGAAARACGVDVIDCGVVPTPALAQRSIGVAAAIMVTGSHLAGDRNGLKFYVPTGEISKADESAILAAYQAGAVPVAGQGRAFWDGTVAQGFGDRYLAAFGSTALAGVTIGVYEHSSAARDILTDVLTGLGARVHSLMRSDHFIPVDTEALDQRVLAELCRIAHAQGLDAIVSTDGDGDRPMVMDHLGQIVPGDVLGVLTARYLKAQVVCTPVSSNDMVQQISDFEAVHLTRIGSPYVIAAMEAVQAAEPYSAVVGFEANGGFLLGFEAQLAGRLPPLMTRDSLLPLIAPLAAANAAGQTVAALRNTLPPCFTAADRVQNIDPIKAESFLKGLIEVPSARAAFFNDLGEIRDIDLTDGLRINFTSGEVVHVRPSGNAPEFRLYVQAGDPGTARDILKRYIGDVAHHVI